MKTIRKSRGAAGLVAVALGLAVLSQGALAAAQVAPTGLSGPTTPLPAKPAAAPQPAAPAAAKPTATAAKPAAKPADAKALMTSGEKKFKAGDFTGSLADFEAAEAAKPSPEVERFVAVSHDKLGQYVEAVAAYDKFLANVPAKMKDQGEEAKKRVEEIKAMPGKVHVETTPTGAQVAVAGPGAAEAPKPTATPADLELAPGHHTLKISAEGFTSADKEVDVTFASKQEVRVELAKVEAPPPPPVTPEAPPAPVKPAPAPPPEPRSKVPAYVTGAVAIVATGVGVGFGLKALSQSSDFDKSPTTKTADDGENNALVADMMFGIAITFGVTSAVLFLSDDAPQSAKANSTRTVARPAKAPRKVSVTPAPYVTPTGGGASALIRF